jgi:putative copper resistance protein D
MVQHFVLITIAPPLLLFGAPMTVLMVAMGSSKRRRYILPLLHSSLFRFFTHPLVGIALFIIVPTFWYVTPAFASSLTSVPLHFIGYAVFLFAGIHYWWPIIGNNPTRWTLSYPVRLVYVLALVPRTWGPSPLLDQQIAGAFMFIFGEAVGLIVVMIVAVQWSRYEDRVGKRLNVMLDKNQHIRSLKEN